MAEELRIYSTQFARILAICMLLSGTALAFESVNPEAGPSLVRVNIISEIPGAKGMVILDGKLLNDYTPILIRNFSSTGVVIDQKGHIMAFLGYRWIDIQSHKPRIEIITNEGQKWEGKLIGIDQSNGVAVIQLLKGKLQMTPVCKECEVKDGAIVMAPVVKASGVSQLGEAQIVSVGTGSTVSARGNWMFTMNSPFPGIGQPILTRDGKVLGFVADRNPIDMEVMVYPIEPMLASAEKILKAGGDIRAGWLGLFLEDSPAGVFVQRVTPDSPAQIAGLTAGDALVRYNGQKIQDTRQLIQLIQDSAIGANAKLEILRQGNPLNLAAVVEERKPQPIQGRLSLNLPKPTIGLDTMVLTPDLADAMQMPGQTGLLVLDVVKQTPAERAGVLAGDVVIAMDGQPVFDVGSFASYWQTHGLGPQLVLKILRKGTERTLTVLVRPESQIK
jgi:S1-C subfamily serine protease